MAPEKTDNNPKYVLNNVIEAISIVTKLLDAKDGLGLTQLSNCMRITKNKTFRLLATLVQCGIVDKDQKNNYSIGIATIGIARRMLARNSTLDSVRPWIEGLVKLFNEAVYFAYYKDGKAVLVDYVDCSHPIRATSFVGITLSHSDSINLVTNCNCVTKIGDITLSVGGLDPDITTVSIPFFNDRGVRTGALVVLAPTFRMSMDRINTEIVPALKEVMQQVHGNAKDISQLFAHPVVKAYVEHTALVSGVSRKKDKLIRVVQSQNAFAKENYAV